MDCDYDEEYSNIEYLEDDENLENNNKINLELEPSRELFKWDSGQTFCLIDIVKQHYDKFDYQLERKIWTEIAKELYNVCGFKVTGDQCDFKFKSLKIIYEQVKLNNKLQTWKFFDALDDMLSSNEKLDPLAINTYSVDIDDSEEVTEPYLFDDSEEEAATFSNSEEVSAPIVKQKTKKSTLLPSQDELQKLLNNSKKSVSNNYQKQDKPLEAIRWNRELTFSLIDAVNEHYSKYDYGMPSKSWIQISNKMRNISGIAITESRCMNKFKSLTQKYRSIKSNKQESTDWEFYKPLDEMFSKRAISSDYNKPGQINQPLLSSNYKSSSPNNHSEQIFNNVELELENQSCDEMDEDRNNLFKWTTHQTACFINSIKIHSYEYHTEKKKKFWIKMAKEMKNLYGSNVTWEQCDNKFKTMKKKYNRFKVNNKPWKTWPFFQAVEYILNYRPTFDRTCTTYLPAKNIEQPTLESPKIHSELLNNSSDIEEQMEFKWRVSETFYLIDAIRNTLERSNSKEIIWEDVANEVENLCGCEATWEQCEFRFNSLLRMYKKVKLNKYPTIWRYLTAMENLLLDKPNCNSVCNTEELPHPQI